MLGELTDRRLPQQCGRRDHDRHVARTHTDVREVHRRVVDVFQVDPRVREPGAVRERPQGHRLGRVARTDDANGSRALPARRISRRATSARKTVSEKSGFVLISCRNVASGTTSTRPGCEMRAVRNALCPVSRLSSPRNRCSPCVATTTSPLSSRRTISTSPSSTTKKSGVGSPARYKMSPRDLSDLAERLQLLEHGPVEPRPRNFGPVGLAHCGRHHRGSPFFSAP